MELHFTRKDFVLEWFSGSGAGGQHRNKHQNCCRIRHIATGISAQGTAHRERSANQRDAFYALARRLIAHYTPEVERRHVSAVIRNYHGVRNEVHDKASGLKRPYTEVLRDLGPMIEARRRVLT